LAYSISAVGRERGFCNDNPISVAELANLVVHRGFPIVSVIWKAATKQSGCNRHDDGSTEKSHGWIREAMNQSWRWEPSQKGAF
jgi:hypothetical protein